MLLPHRREQPLVLTSAVGKAEDITTCRADAAGNRHIDRDGLLVRCAVAVAGVVREQGGMRQP